MPTIARSVTDIRQRIRSFITKPWAARAAASVVGSSAGVAIVILQSTTQVCGQQVASTGTVVTVCRSPALSDPTIAVLGLVVLLSLSFWFSEISGFGITLKTQVKEAQETAERAESKAIEAQGASESAGRMAETAQAFRRNLGSRPAEEWLTESDALAEVRRLAGEYEQVRANLPKGAQRTGRMTAIVSAMLGVFSSVDVQDSSMPLWLDGSAGERLAAYAYYYLTPNASVTGRIVQAAVGETQAFTQYWALRSLRSIVESAPGSVHLTDRRALEGFSAALPSSSDRGYEVNKVLAAIRYD